VNSSSILGGAAGTVLFDGAHADRRLTTVGAENWDMTGSVSILKIQGTFAGAIGLVLLQAAGWKHPDRHGR